MVHVFILQVLKNTLNHDLIRTIEISLLFGGAFGLIYMFFGRFYSMSNMLGSIVNNPLCDYSRTSLILVCGLIFSSAVIHSFYHDNILNLFPFNQQQYIERIDPHQLILAGLLVGFGSQLSSGYQENDGFLGVPRLHKHSTVSFLLVFTTAALSCTFQIDKHLPELKSLSTLKLPKNIDQNIYLVATLILPFLCFLLAKKKSIKTLMEALLYFLSGVSIGLAYMLLGMSKRANFDQAFTVSSHWVARYMMAIWIAGVLFLLLHLLIHYTIKKPLFSNKIINQNPPITNNLILGSVLVGLGWGIGKVSLETFLLNITGDSIHFMIFWGIPCLFAMMVARTVIDRQGSIAVIQKTMD